MHFLSRTLSLIVFTFFTLCIPAHVQADTINFFEHLSLQHKAQFLIASAAFLAGAVGIYAINGKTSAPANDNNNSGPSRERADNSDNSTVAFPNTVPKIIGTLICAAMTITGGYFAKEASYGR